MINRFQGDPRIFLSANGSRLIFKGGQPVMDAGLENAALIRLFTRRGWVGNSILESAEEKIGSEFLAACEQPITLKSLNNIRLAGIQALKDPAFGVVTVEIRNPNGNRLDIFFRIKPPFNDALLLLVSKNGLNWAAQAKSLNSKYDIGDNAAYYSEGSVFFGGEELLFGGESVLFGGE